MSTRANEFKPSGPASFDSLKTPTILYMAFAGAVCAAFGCYLWISWILSPQFHPVDPGPDPIPMREYATLVVIQIGGLIATIWMVWAIAIAPRLKTGIFTTDGLIVLAFPLIWWMDPTYNYSQNWFVYNAHLWNMGSWVGDIWPTWLGANGDKYPEPFVVGLAQIFWLYFAMVVGSWGMRKYKSWRPHANVMRVLMAGYVVMFIFDLIMEYTAVQIGWYSMPGAWRAVSLHPGTRYQVPLTAIAVSALQCTGFASMHYFRDDKGYSWVERGVGQLRSFKTIIRYFALVGGLSLATIFLYALPAQFNALHTDEWPEGLPSYLTMICPEYKTHRESCGGRGVPIYRPQHNWLPDASQTASAR